MNKEDGDTATSYDQNCTHFFADFFADIGRTRTLHSRSKRREYWCLPLMSTNYYEDTTQVELLREFLHRGKEKKSLRRKSICDSSLARTRVLQIPKKCCCKTKKNNQKTNINPHNPFQKTISENTKFPVVVYIPPRRLVRTPFPPNTKSAIKECPTNPTNKPTNPPNNLLQTFSSALSDLSLVFSILSSARRQAGRSAHYRPAKPLRSPE